MTTFDHLRAISATMAPRRAAYIQEHARDDADLRRVLQRGVAPDHAPGVTMVATRFLERFKLTEYDRDVATRKLMIDSGIVTSPMPVPSIVRDVRFSESRSMISLITREWLLFSMTTSSSAAPIPGVSDARPST